MLRPNSSLTNYILLTKILTAKQKERDLLSVSDLDFWRVDTMRFNAVAFHLRAGESKDILES